MIANDLDFKAELTIFNSHVRFLGILKSTSMKKIAAWAKKIFSFPGLVFAFLKVYSSKLKENRNLKVLHYVAIFLLFLDIAISFLKAWNHSHPQFLINMPELWLLEGFKEPILTFVGHFWIEIFSGILIYILLEDRIKKINEIPQAAGKRDHEKLLKEFAKSAIKKIRILDTSIYSFIEHPHIFKDNLDEALSKPHLEIEMLLLHPDTYAAEQRSKDLTISTKEYLDKMKIGLARLNDFKRSLDKRKSQRVHIKLFKNTPMMIYASWDGNVNFGILHPNKIADLKDTFFVRKEGDLPKSFENYFDDLWKGETQNKTVFLDNYLFVKLSDGGDELDNLYWGGDDENRELPRYITDMQNNKWLSKLSKISDKNEYTKIKHDNATLLCQIKRIDEAKDQNKYQYANLQIKRTYGHEIPDFGTAIFLINYLYENQITFSHKNLIKEKLDLHGYVFVSHNHYDVKIRQFLRDRYDCLARCYNEDLETDIYDEEAIKKRKLTDNGYNSNPRKRLMAVYECNINNGLITTKAVKGEDYYPYPFKIEHDGKEVYGISERKYTTLQNLIDVRESLKDEENCGYLEKTDSFIKSTIKADIINILGHNEYIDTKKKFKVYVSLIRTWASSESPTAYPTPQTLTQTHCQYEVIHLVKREFVIGGINNIEIGRGTQYPVKDSLLLENPLDSVFFKKDLIRDSEELRTEHSADVIHFNPDARYYKKGSLGCRDVLVIEFSELIQEKAKP